MKAIVFQEGSTWGLDEVPQPEPGPGETLLRVLLTGVCGTDEHLLHGGFIAKFPLIPGHEMVCEVLRHGPSTQGMALGTRVVVDNTIHCGECGPCRDGRPLFCEQFVSLGCNAPGAFAEYVVVRTSKLYDIGSLPLDVAVLTEPLSCAMHGVDVLGLSPGSNVLVFGAGPTGLLLSQLLKMAGAASVTVAAPTQSKLDLALLHGANNIVKLERNDLAEAIDSLREIAPEGFDAVIEATGKVTVLEAAVQLARTGGTILVYGLAGENDVAEIKPYEIFSRELTIKGSFAQAFCIGRALFTLQSGSINTEGIITQTVGLNGFATALKNLHDPEHIKTVVGQL
ncbi:zinc-dependent alcohol dehydrogenase family protein [Arthrobacter psychrochitiniphilus]|nr:zinc-dependent alcohol dehydrogenase family protein [Arthrobacter psychrochitiniphilus]